MAILRASLTAHVTSERRASASGGTATEKAEYGRRGAMTSGTGTRQVDEAWSDTERSVAAAANDDIDLQSLTLLDDDGNTLRSGISFSKLKGLYIKNTSALDSTGHLVVGGAASNAWEGGGALLEGAGDTIRIAPGRTLLIEDDEGMAVGATSKVLRVAGVTATQTFDIWAVGNP